MADNLEKLLATLRANKGHLTRAIRRADDVQQRAENSPHANIVSEIDDVVRLLDNRLASIAENYSAVVELDPSNVESYIREQDAEEARHLLSKSKLLTVLGALQGRPAPAAAPAATALLTPTNEVLKPFTLTKDHSPSELRLWIEKLQTYCEASRMGDKPHNERIAYVSQCLSPYLYEKIRGSITGATPVLPGADPNLASVVSLIREEFASRYPLFTRRLEFFDSRQPGQPSALSDCYVELIKLSKEADLERMTPQDIIVFRVIFGMTDDALRKRFFAEKDLNLKRMEDIIREHEVSQAAMRALRHEGSRATAAAVSNPRSRQGRQQGQGAAKKMQRLRQQGKCYRCAKSLDSHDEGKCPAKDLSCHNCGKLGHIAPTCFAPKEGRSGRQQDRGPSKARGRSKSKGRAAFRKKSQSRSSSRGSEPGKVTAINAVGGYNKPAEKLLVWLTPRKKPRHGSAATFRYACTADTGASETVMSASLAKQFDLRPVESLGLRLMNASGEKMTVLGGVELTLSAGGREIKTVAQITTSMKEGVLLCLKDLKGLGVVPQDFPRPQYPGTVKAVEADSTEAINQLLNEYQDVLKTSGDKFPPMKGGPMKIHLREDVAIKPHKCSTTRPIPLHMKDAARKLIDELVESDVIEKVAEPSEWCHRGFFVPKPNRPTDPRLVVNLQPLNRYVQRPVHPFPSPRDVVKAIEPESRYFAKLDLLHGYFQIELDSPSSKLLSFLLPDGVYRFKRAPMGLCSSGDEFCQRSDEALAGIPGCIKLVDDILVQAATMEDLLKRLRAVFQRCREHCITLAKKKVKVGKEVDFAGFTVSAEGVRPDPKLVAGIAEMAAPTNTSELRSFLGLAQQLTMFVPDLAHATCPLSALLKKDVAWTWGDEQVKAFELAKKNLTSPLVVKVFDPSLRTALLTDASRLKGLGYALVQYEGERMHLVQCGSRTLTPTETRYATCELEALAIHYGITSAKHYLLGRQEPFKVLTDHKPLVGIFKKELSDMSNTRILRYRERLANFNFTVEWVPGKSHQIADALSRSPVFSPTEEAEECAQNDTAAICSVIAADPLLEELASAAGKDAEYQEILRAVRKGLKLKELPDGHPARQLKSVWDSLSTFEDTFVVYDSDRLMVPKACRPAILSTLHAAHPGINRMRSSAQALYYWPGLSSDIKNLVETCDECRKHLPSQPHDTPKPYPVTDAPMEQVALDLFSLKGTTYLLMVDRYSYYTWVQRLRSLTTSAVTAQLTKWFQDFGYPKSILSDSGPQMRSEFDSFCRQNYIVPIKSSAYNPESNGLAESAVKQMKLLLKKVASFAEFEKALVHWRNTSGDNHRSKTPAELFFGRRLRTCLPSLPPQSQQAAQPQAQSATDVPQPINEDKYDELLPGETVTVQDPHSKLWDRTAQVIRKRKSERSYIIEMDGRETTRNRRFMKRLPNKK